MGKLLNSKKASMLFKEDTESTYFVDKTALLDELLPIIDPNVQAYLMAQKTVPAGAVNTSASPARAVLESLWRRI